MKNKIVKVIWYDAIHYPRISKKDVDEISVLKESQTVGFLLKEDKEKVIITHSSEPDEYRETTVIPKATIKKIIVLKE